MTALEIKEMQIKTRRCEFSIVKLITIFKVKSVYKMP